VGVEHPNPSPLVTPLCLMGTSQILYCVLHEGADYIIRMEDGRILKIALNGKFFIQGQWEKEEQDGRTSS